MKIVRDSITKNTRLEPEGMWCLTTDDTGKHNGAQTRQSANSPLSHKFGTGDQTGCISHAMQAGSYMNGLRPNSSVPAFAALRQWPKAVSNCLVANHCGPPSWGPCNAHLGNSPTLLLSLPLQYAQSRQVQFIEMWIEECQHHS